MEEGIQKHIPATLNRNRVKDGRMEGEEKVIWTEGRGKIRKVRTK